MWLGEPEAGGIKPRTVLAASMLPLQVTEPVLPPAETGGVALALSLLAVVVWTLYLYR
jgi:hypothetical protein